MQRDPEEATYGEESSLVSILHVISMLQALTSSERALSFVDLVIVREARASSGCPTYQLRHASKV